MFYNESHVKLYYCLTLLVLSEKQFQKKDKVCMDQSHAR